MSAHPLLDGPPLAHGAESLAAHTARLGALPPHGDALLRELDESGLRGRGGAAFPVGTKWRSVASRRGRPVVLVNGAEGEWLSHKDRTLMACRPHLVLDGAELAARTLGAAEVVFYIGMEHAHARAAMTAALRERRGRTGAPARIVLAPQRYIAGEETAAVHCVNDGIALPQTTPPRPFERGVAGRPTLVQNVETLANVTLIARRGAAGYRAAGVAGAAGTVLLTVVAATPAPVLVEAPQGTTLDAAIAVAGGSPAGAAVLVGGGFGTWVAPEDVPRVVVDTASAHSISLGAGVVAVQPPDRCGVGRAAQLLEWLAAESAGQCGPCVFGLRAMSDAMSRVAACRAQPDDVARLRRWSTEIRRRGACRHPDGAAQMIGSALDVFAAEVAFHVGWRRCSSPAQAVVA